MSRAEKALTRLQSKPRDFSWGELITVMESFDYALKTSPGSSRKFIPSDTKAVLFMHQPHPANVLKAYQVRDALAFLKEHKHV